MARLVYACKFEVPSKSGFDEVLDVYGKWLARHYHDRHGLPEFSFDPAKAGQADRLPNHHTLSSTMNEADVGKAARIGWSFPDANDAGLRWLNDIRVGQFGDRCSVEHLISIKSVEYNVAPARFVFGSPRVVRDICARTPTYVGDMRFGPRPMYFIRRGWATLRPC